MAPSPKSICRKVERLSLDICSNKCIHDVNEPVHILHYKYVTSVSPFSVSVFCVMYSMDVIEKQARLDILGSKHPLTYTCHVQHFKTMSLCF